MVVVDGQGVPLGDYLHSASPAEVKLVEKTLAAIRVRRRHHGGRPRQKPERMIMDRGYDSDGLRKQLRRRGIEPIVPHRKGRRKPSMQDGRALRRYKRRWIVERTFAWISRNRRLARDFERYSRTVAAFFRLAMIRIMLRRLARPTPSA